MRSRDSARVAIVGAGPAGLFLARMVGLSQPGSVIDVYERSGPDGSSGFGVGLSDRTMTELAGHDPDTHRRIMGASTTLTGVELRLPGTNLRYDGFGVSSISRSTLLSILREQAEQAGATVHYRRPVSAASPVTAARLGADVLAIADGAGSSLRGARKAFGTTTRTGAARYIWLGVAADFGEVTRFSFVPTEFGPMAAHTYRYAEDLSTVVIETDKCTWRNAGLNRAVLAGGHAGEIDPAALELLSSIFADQLGGHQLISNRSKWGRFAVVHNERWSDGDAVLLGDAAHTAHFTVGSGTKLAIEDGIALATALAEHPEPAAAFAEYEAQRRPQVARTQRWAEPSMYWWETFGRRLDLPPAQFGMHFITRTVAISYLGLRRRCGGRVADAEAAYRQAAGVHPDEHAGNAVGVPFGLGPARLPHRRVVAQPADDGGQLVTVRAACDGPRADGRSPATALVFQQLRCPAQPEWSPAADDLVSRARAAAAGAQGVLLLADDLDLHTGWDEYLRHASRIRTETGLAGGRVRACGLGAGPAPGRRARSVADPDPSRVDLRPDRPDRGGTSALGAGPDLLNRPGVVVRVVEVDELAAIPAVELIDLADVHTPLQQLRAGGFDVGHDQLQTLDRAGFGRGRAQHDRAPRARRGQLDDTEAVADLVVEVDVETHLVGIEVLGPIDIGHRHGHNFKRPIHLCCLPLSDALPLSGRGRSWRKTSRSAIVPNRTGAGIQLRCVPSLVENHAAPGTPRPGRRMMFNPACEPSGLSRPASAVRPQPGVMAPASTSSRPSTSTIADVVRSASSRSRTSVGDSTRVGP